MATPRLSNAVIVDHDKINWIDFRSARFDERSRYCFVADMRVLMQSLFEGSAVPQNFATALEEYDTKQDDSVELLVAALHESGMRA
eukprot:scaffold202666_cov35-Attheya_sp.AAC.2